MCEQAMLPGAGRVGAPPTQGIASWLEANPVLVSSTSLSTSIHRHHRPTAAVPAPAAAAPTSYENSTETNPPHLQQYHHPSSTETMTVMAASAVEGVGGRQQQISLPCLVTDMWEFVAEATACPSPVYFSHQHGSSM